MKNKAQENYKKQRITKVSSGYHYENPKGEEVQLCDSCEKWLSIEKFVFCEDANICTRCASILEKQNAPTN